MLTGKLAVIALSLLTLAAGPLIGVKDSTVYANSLDGNEIGFNQAGLTPLQVTNIPVVWQIGTFDGVKDEFFAPGTRDTDFVCDSPVAGGSGTAGNFIIGSTPDDMFPAEIRSSDASTTDGRYMHSCDSVTIEFTTTQSLEDGMLFYSRMGGEVDSILFDNVPLGSNLSGFAGAQIGDPFAPTTYFLVDNGKIPPGTHTIQIVGEPRSGCSIGADCIAGKSIGYHWVDALQLRGRLK